MKKLILIMFMMVSTVYANDIYITQSGATLDLDITQDGQNTTIGSSSTVSSISGATTNFDIRQVGNSNVITFDVNGDNYTGTWNITGNFRLCYGYTYCYSIYLQ